MSILRNIASGLRWLFRKEKVGQELGEELNGFLEMAIEEKMKQGMSPKDALRAVRLERGNLDVTKEEVRSAGWESFLETCWQDLRYGLRMLRQSPGFAAVAVLTLGIGANTAIFSIVDAVLLRPLPFKNPSRLVMLWEGIPEIGFAKIGASAPDLMLYKREQKSCDSVGAFQNEELAISGGTGGPERITAARVSFSIFPMLGVPPLIGRTYTRGEDESRANVAVLSYGLWQRRYAADPNIVGRTVDLDRMPHIVLGVMPKNFVFPLRGLGIVAPTGDLH